MGLTKSNRIDDDAPVIAWGGKMMKGESFNRDGSLWLCVSCIQDENKYFTWDIVVAKWSGFGPRPRYADEEHVFLMNRRQKPMIDEPVIAWGAK